MMRVYFVANEVVQRVMACMATMVEWTLVRLQDQDMDVTRSEEALRTTKREDVRCPLESGWK
jgi:hypothetical protein